MDFFYLIGFVLVFFVITFSIILNRKIEHADETKNEKIKKLIQENAKLKNQLKFYTQIDSDSRNFNEDDSFSREKKIRKLPASVSETENANAVSESDSKNYKEQHSDSERKFLDVNVIDILDDEQKEAFDKINNTKSNYFITGKAGTGKSFLLEAFVRKTKKRVVKLAPTGIAALNIKGATLHRTFGYNNLNELELDRITLESLRLKEENKLVLKRVDTIIIDEVSMVRADVLDRIDRILKVLNDTQKPFGGKQIILFGDVFQLPPIANKIEEKYLLKRYGGVYFFDSESYKFGNFKFVELTVNHRQKEDRAFFEILNRMREGKTTDKDIQILNQRVVHNFNDIGRILSLYPKKSDAEKKNELELKRIEAEEYVYNSAVLYSEKEMIPVLEKIFPIKEELRLKCGAVVMMVSNDLNKRWVNGTIGIVNRLEKNRIFVTINGQAFEIYPHEFVEQKAICIDEKLSYVDVLKVSQYPIVPAYAITIHKSQGMTFKKIACDISMCFAPGQAYVALSRCTSLNGLNLLKEIDCSMVKTNNHVVDFYEHQKQNLKLDALLQNKWM